MALECQQRIPVPKAGWREKWSVHFTNLALLALFLSVGYFIGFGAVLAVQIPILIIGATIGVWLFYIQHQFEGATWSRNGIWQRDEAALAGSSHYDLPPVLRWFTANIGIHHVHHLSARIPFYRLNKVLRDHPELKPMSRVGLLESFRCARLALWDEANDRLVSFREAHARA